MVSSNNRVRRRGLMAKATTFKSRDTVGPYLLNGSVKQVILSNQCLSAMSNLFRNNAEVTCSPAKFLGTWWSPFKA